MAEPWDWGNHAAISPGMWETMEALRRPGGKPLLPHNKQNALVLAVDLAVAAHGSRRVSRSQRQLLEDPLLQGATRVYGIQIAVLAVSVNHAVGIHRVAVHAPLEPFRMCVRDAGDRPIRLAGATIVVGAL